MVRKSNLEIKESQIPGAGNGLYTKVKIKKDTIICRFEGDIVSNDELELRPNSYGWIVTIDDNTSIDCSSKFSEAKYANDAEGLQMINGLYNNCEICYDYDDEQIIYIVAMTDIEKDSELFISYGKDYWDAIKYNKEEKERTLFFA